MLKWIVIAAVTAAIVYLAIRSLKRMGERERAQSAAHAANKTIDAPLLPEGSDAERAAEGVSTPDPDPGDASSASGAPSPDIEAIAAALDPVYERSAHPQLLESHPTFQQAVAMLADAKLPLDTVINYCIGANQPLAAAALEAMVHRADSAPAVSRIIDHLYYTNAWNAYFLLRFVRSHAQSPVIGSVLVQARDWWPDNVILPPVLADFIVARLDKGEEPDLFLALQTRAPDDLDDFERLLRKMPPQVSPRLLDDLRRWRGSNVDLDFLRSVGLVWGEEQLHPRTVLDDRLRAQAQSALDAIQAGKSIMVTGDAGTGKTAFVRALAADLMDQGWTFFQASGSEVNAGQSYIGALEERVRQLLANLGTGRRVLWYVPQFHELLYVGRHSQSPIGLLDLLLPAMDAGQVCIVGELRTIALERLLQLRPRLRYACARVDLAPASESETLRLARQLIDQDYTPSHLSMTPEALREAFQLARHYLHSMEAPGHLLNLLRQARESVLKSGQGGAVERDVLLDTVAQITGLPRMVLDERAGLDANGLRQFFETRVMGQPEAVSCLVDRIAMLKAGLTDPDRPVGVFLFAGPTGTGKTEVAKVLAEFLFGSAERMIRLDMSEFQDPHTIGRLIGQSSDMSDSDALVHRIRRQPFSVVLLDEFEKAHPRVWDLFLQVFDDARLTDALGNVADFRHSIIILTSNLGAAEHKGGSLGFVNAQGVFTPAQVLRTVGTTFRPEFVNRIDRVVVFRPLSRTVMRDILRKELREILQRRGFRHRDWAVEWEESALEFLLQKGFTPDMGARPLRRAIDEYVLAPIAMTIVENRFPEGDQFLFVRAAHDALEVEFVDPDAPAQPAAPVERAANLSYPPLMLSASGSEKERAFLEQGCQALERQLTDALWNEAKQQLLDAMKRPSFWNDDARFATLAQVENMDSIEAGFATAQSLLRRLGGRSGRAAPASIVSNLAQLLYLLGHALEDRARGRSRDVYLGIDAVAADGSSPRSAAWKLEIARMYQGWATKRRMRWETLNSRNPRAAVLMSVSGFGAHGILAREIGVHVLEIPDAQGGFDRHSVRVRVAPQALVPARGDADPGELASRALEGCDGNLNAIVRRYRRDPSPLVRDAVSGWRTGRIDQVLDGDFDLMMNEEAPRDA